MAGVSLLACAALLKGRRVTMLFLLFPARLGCCCLLHAISGATIIVQCDVNSSSTLMYMRAHYIVCKLQHCVVAVRCSGVVPAVTRARICASPKPAHPQQHLGVCLFHRLVGNVIDLPFALQLCDDKKPLCAPNHLHKRSQSLNSAPHMTTAW